MSGALSWLAENAESIDRLLVRVRHIASLAVAPTLAQSAAVLERRALRELSELREVVEAFADVATDLFDLAGERMREVAKATFDASKDERTVLLCTELQCSSSDMGSIVPATLALEVMTLLDALRAHVQPTEQLAPSAPTN